MKWWDYDPSILVGVSPEISQAVEEIEERTMNPKFKKYHNDRFIISEKESCVYLLKDEKKQFLYSLV